MKLGGNYRLLKKNSEDESVHFGVDASYNNIKDWVEYVLKSEIFSISSIAAKQLRVFAAIWAEIAQPTNNIMKKLHKVASSVENLTELKTKPSKIEIMEKDREKDFKTQQFSIPRQFRNYRDMTLIEDFIYDGLKSKYDMEWEDVSFSRGKTTLTITSVARMADDVKKLMKQSIQE